MFSTRVRSNDNDARHDLEALGVPGPWQFEFLLAEPTRVPDDAAYHEREMQRSPFSMRLSGCGSARRCPPSIAL